MKTILTAALFAAVSAFGIVGLTHNPSNLVCSALAAALPLWIIIQAWDKSSIEEDLAGDL